MKNYLNNGLILSILACLPLSLSALQIDSFTLVPAAGPYVVGDSLQMTVNASTDDEEDGPRLESAVFFIDGVQIGDPVPMSGTSGSAQQTGTLERSGNVPVRVQVFATQGGVASRTVTIPVQETLPNPAVSLSSVSISAGVYGLTQRVSFSFTIANELEAFTDTNISENQRDAINNRRSARVSSEVFLRGLDIYGNEVFIPGGFTENGTINRLGPGESRTLTGQVTIPNDGTLHNMNESAFRIFAESFVTNFVGQGDPSVSATSSDPDIQIEVIPNLILDRISYVPGTYRGGDIIEITYEILNQSRFGETLQTRPVGPLSGDEFRNVIYLTADPMLSATDFQLGFSDFGNAIPADGGGFIPDGRSDIRNIRTDFQPFLRGQFLPAYGGGDPDRERIYLPQPGDGNLDVGERVIVTQEFMIPKNYAGTFFVGGITNSREILVEQEYGTLGEVNPDRSNASRPQGDNVLVIESTPQITIIPAEYPTMGPVSEVTAPDGSQLEESDGFSDLPSVSENGDFIVFQSLATNLVEGVETGGFFQVYLRNRKTGEISMVSVDNNGSAGNGDSINPQISADGRTVVFESLATNLTGDLLRANSNVYIRDRANNRTRLVSRNAQGTPANASSFTPAINDNGRYITFVSGASNLDPSISGLAGNPPPQVYVHNRSLNGSSQFDLAGNTATRLVSLGNDGLPIDRFAQLPAISLDGQVIAYVSRAFNLPGFNNIDQVYMQRLSNGAPISGPELISVGMGGESGNAISGEPALNGGPSSPHGIQLVFSSQANNLVPNDTNQVSDIFVRDFSDPVNPVTRIISISNERVAYGEIVFFADFDPSMPPQNNPSNGEWVEISDGEQTVRFTFGSNVQIGVNAAISRNNLVEAINDSDLNINAFASAQQSVSDIQPGVAPALVLFNTIPGTQGNVSMQSSLGSVILTFGMSGGGTQSIDPYLGSAESPASGSLQPSIDRSGAVIAFRSLTNNLSIFEDPNDPLYGQWIRPLLNRTSNVFLHDRDVTKSGALDVAGNTNIEKISNNRFGYPTGGLADVPSSGSSRAPSVSADGRFVGLATDSQNTAGLRFGRTNRIPLDDNNLRDVFIYDRNVNVLAPDVPVIEPSVRIVSPADGTGVARQVPIRVVAQVNDPRGELGQVVFRHNGIIFGSRTSAPFEAEFIAEEVGNVNIEVRFISTLGVELAADSIGINVFFSPLANTSDFVAQAFQDLYVEAPSQAVLNRYTRELNEGLLTEAQLYAQLLSRFQGQNGVSVVGAYETLLGRLPTVPEYQAGQLGTSLDIIQPGPGTGTIPISVGETVTGSFDTSFDIDRFSFSVTNQGTILTARANSSLFMRLTFRDDSGGIVSQSADGFYIRDPSLTATFSPGNYILEAEAIGSGLYTLSLVGTSDTTPPSSGGSTDFVLNDLLNQLFASQEYLTEFGPLPDFTGPMDFGPGDQNRRAFVNQLYRSKYNGNSASDMQQYQGSIRMFNFGGYLPFTANFITEAPLTDGSALIFDAPSKRNYWTTATLIIALFNQNPTPATINEFNALPLLQRIEQMLADPRYRDRFDAVTEPGQNLLFPGSPDTAGWVESWIGWVNISFGEWYFHDRLGWLYANNGSNPSGVWLFSPVFGWVWTNQNAFHWLYSNDKSGWQYYDPGSSNPVWFYDFNSGQWNSY